MTASRPSLPILIPRAQIAARVAAIGAEISRDFADQSLLLVAVLKGAAFFLADLARTLTLETELDYIAVSSYRHSQNSSGAVRLIKDLDESIEGRNIVLVEDILDSGLTLAYLQTLLRQRHPRCLKTAVLLDKPARRQKPVVADYIGFSIPDHFVVGYGLDFAGRYRHLPDICRIEER